MNLSKFLNSRQNTVIGAAMIITLAVLASRILGLLRDRLLAGTFGASTDLDIYYAAFKIPDFVYSVLFAGGVIVSLLPLFSEYHRSDKKESWNVVNNILNLFLVGFGFLAMFFFIFTPQIVSIMVPGFSPEAQAKTIELTRLLFTSVFFFGISSIFSTVLNYFNRFVSYSLALISYNLGIIAGVVFLAPYFGIFGAGIGVIIGSFLQLIVQIPSSLKCGYEYKPIIQWKHPAIKEFFQLIIPRTIASSVSQLNFMVITFLASGIGSGAISVFNLSNNLRYLPIGIIGISFATAVFPELSKAWANEDRESFYVKLRNSFLQVLYISFPVGALIFILRNQIVEIILETGQFTYASVNITAACLGLYFISTFAQCLVPILLRGFFSLKDTRTPTCIAIIFVVLNIILSFIFVNIFNTNNYLSGLFAGIFGLDGKDNRSILGLSLAFNIGLLSEFIMLFYFLKRKVGDFGIKQIISSSLKIVVSTVVMAVLAWLSLVVVAKFTMNALIQFCLAGIVSLLAYAALTLMLKSREAQSLKRYITNKINGD